MTKKEDIINRFWKRINKTDRCWEWTGPVRNKFGYGRCNMNGEATYPHLVSYNLLVGNIPEGKYVCHTCNNPKCVNPEHLYLDSLSDKKKKSKVNSNAYKAQWAKNYRDISRDTERIRARDSELKRKYNISLEDYQVKLISQNYGCEICGYIEPEQNKKYSLNVDHCHSTGKVRGLLCRFCNYGLGNFKDDRELMMQAIKYLNKYES